MANLIALDWDSHELRAVIARSTNNAFSVVDAVSVAIADDSAETVTAAIRKLLDDHGIGKGKAKALVTIGRGKSELRQLMLPPVPENELPDMVRLQAMQTFAGIGDNTIVDFLPLPSADGTTPVLAAAVAPATMKLVSSIIEGAGLELERVALRPVAAAALYQISASKSQSLDDSSIVGDVVLVDMLADDVEIVVMRGRRVMFVRSVRMPQESADRPSQIAGELRRSLMACGINTSSTSQKVVIWGQSKTHDAERVKMSESLGCRVSTLDPLSLVDMSGAKRASAGTMSSDQTHTGRFAPLIGLLAADATAHPTFGSPYLVDFLNPRKTIEVKRDNRKWIAVGAAIAAAALFAGFGAWSSLRTRDAKIKTLELELALMKPKVEMATANIERTELVDKFLDGNVIWIEELARTAKQMPPAEVSILKSVSAVAPPREGGGKLTLTGAAKSPVVVDQLDTALRDDTHIVVGAGSTDLGEKEAYRWGFRETISIPPQAVREQRYSVLAALREQAAAPETAVVAEATKTEEALEPVVITKPVAEAPAEPAMFPASDGEKPSIDAATPATDESPVTENAPQATEPVTEPTVTEPVEAEPAITEEPSQVELGDAA